MLRHLLLAAQVAAAFLLQGLPTGRQDKPYFLLSLAFALTGLLPWAVSMAYGAVCGALCDLSGCGSIGFFALTAALVCAAASYRLKNVWQNRFLTRSLLCAAAVVLTIGLYFLLFRAWQENSVSLLPHYLWRMLLTWLAALPFYGVNALLLRRHGQRA